VFAEDVLEALSALANSNMFSKVNINLAEAVIPLTQLVSKAKAALDQPFLSVSRNASSKSEQFPRFYIAVVCFVSACF